MSKKVMISQPMGGKSNQEIAEQREKAKAILEAAGCEFVNTLFTDEWASPEKLEERGVEQVPLYFLAKSLEKMAFCHGVYFCKGWVKARGCVLEHEAARTYGLEIFYET